MTTLIETIPEQSVIISITKPTDSNAFIAFHEAAMQKRPESLKPVSETDFLQADFAIVAKGENGEHLGQCLLYNGENTAEKIANYPDAAKNSNSLILTSLSGVKFAPQIFSTITEHTETRSYTNVYAKAHANNSRAADIFNDAGFSIQSRDIFTGDNYESYIFEKVITTQSWTAPSSEVQPTVTPAVAVALGQT